MRYGLEWVKKLLFLPGLSYVRFISRKRNHHLESAIIAISGVQSSTRANLTPQKCWAFPRRTYEPSSTATSEPTHQWRSSECCDSAPYRVKSAHNAIFNFYIYTRMTPECSIKDLVDTIQSRLTQEAGLMSLVPFQSYRP